MHHLADGLTPEEWQKLAAERGARPEDVQKDLAALWQAPAVKSEREPWEADPAPTPVTTPLPVRENNSAAEWLGDRGKKFWSSR